MSEILSDSLAVIMEASGSVYGEVLVYQQESRGFRIATFRGEKDVAPPQRELRLEECDLATQVLTSGEPMLLESLEREPRLLALLEGRSDVGAVAGVPLRSKNSVLGVMYLAIATEQLFPTFDFDLFTSIGNQIGIAAENALLFQRTARQTKEIKVLNNIARIISSSLQIEEVFDAFANEMEKLISFDRLSVAFLDESGSYLRIFASGSRTDSGWGMESLIPLVGTGPGWVVLNETHFIHPDTRNQKRFIEDQFLLEDGIRPYIVLPLESRRRIVGTFGLGSSNAEAFSEKDLPLLTQLSKQISVAIENVKLYQKTKETSILDERQLAIQLALLPPGNRARAQTDGEAQIAFDPAVHRPRCFQSDQRCPRTSARDQGASGDRFSASRRDSRNRYRRPLRRRRIRRHPAGYRHSSSQTAGRAHASNHPEDDVSQGRGYQRKARSEYRACDLPHRVAHQGRAHPFG